MSGGVLRVDDLGAAVEYGAAVALQEQLHGQRVAGGTADTLLLLEHASVYTLGRSAEPHNVLWGAEELRSRGIALFPTSRGGDVTYHGPGQLVGYPIVHLGERGLRVIDYVTALEEVLIKTLAHYAIAGGRDTRNRGVWVADSKVAAIGIRVSRQVAMHGFALNVNTKLSDYQGIVPCGLTNAGVTSMAQLARRQFDMDEVKRNIVLQFKSVFGYSDTAEMAK